MKAIGAWLLDGLPYVLALAIGFGGAWQWQGSRSTAAIATLKAEIASDHQDRAEASARALKSAIERGDRLYLERSKRETALNIDLEKARHALRLATTDRPCLNGRTLGLLNARQTAATGSSVLAGPFDGRLAAAAADYPEEGSYATDTDVADWIAVAQTYYERCRGRIRDIRDFDTSHPVTPSP